MSHVKDLIDQAIDRLGDDLERLSRTIHDNPELAYQEVKAAGWLTEFLSGQGLTVERGVGGIDTAFRATIETGAGPTIAIMCEYDALPAIGHACGHNAIATAGAGAGAALAAVRASLPKGRIQVIGTSGGAAPNIIPESAACLFYVRASALDYLWTLYDRVVACAEGAATATGATLKVIDYRDTVYDPMKRNAALLEAFRANLRAV